MPENINIPDSTITTNLTFRQLVLMNMQQLTNFPYIEKDFDALTDYELLCLVVKYLNDVIANQNEQNDSITRMYESFLALQTYVNNTKDTLEDTFNTLDDYVRNYFENLDVQEEINNKLEQMLEDGEFNTIIQQFLQSTALWTFDTIEDMQQATNLTNGSYAEVFGSQDLNDGGHKFFKITNTGTVDNITVYQIGTSLYAHLINSGAKKISLEDLENVDEGIFTLGEVTVNEPIQLKNRICNKILIVDTIFNINTTHLLEPYAPTSYYTMPSFSNCTFKNLTQNAVYITKGGENTVGSGFSSCKFLKVDMITNNGYVQDFSLVNCYIESHTCFFDEPSTTVQVRFVNCNVESSSAKLIKSDKLYCYMSGTYEGNISKNIYLIESTIANLNFVSCWLEGLRLLHLHGGTAANQKSSISFTDCELVGNQNGIAFALFDDPSLVSLYLNHTRYGPYDSNSRFCTNTPDEFAKLIGTFLQQTAEDYCRPVGNVSIKDYEYATLKNIQDLEDKRFISKQLFLNASVIADGGIDLTIPCGNYLVILGRGGDGVINQSKFMLLGVSTTTSTTYQSVTIATTDGYLNAIVLTPTKSANNSPTFNLNINSTDPFQLLFNMIRIN